MFFPNPKIGSFCQNQKDFCRGGQNAPRKIKTNTIHKIGQEIRANKKKKTWFKRRKQDQQLMYIPFYHKKTCDGKKAMAWAQPPFSKNEPNCLSNQTRKEMEED